MEISGYFSEIRACTYMYPHALPIWVVCILQVNNFPQGILRTQEEKVPPGVIQSSLVDFLKGKILIIIN